LDVEVVLFITYTRCCGVVLMHYNGLYKVRFNALYTLLYFSYERLKNDKL